MDSSLTKIIVNADDFGLGAGIDEGIIRLAQEKRISSTSIVACGEHFHAGTKALLKHVPHLGTGVHLCLDEEMPVLPASDIPTLVGPLGRFLSRSVLMRRLCKGLVKMDEVEKELSAQIEKVLDMGVRITHIDGHGHIHVWPWIADVLKPIANRLGINKARKPFEPLRIYRHDWVRRTPVRLLLNYWTRKSYARGFLKNMYTPKSFFGISVGGRLTEDILGNFPVQAGEVTEIMVHPGLPSRPELDRYDHWRYSWKREFETLSTGCLDRVLDRVRGTLVSYEEVI